MEVGGVSLGHTISLSNISEILSRLNVGNIIRAQIIECTSNELILRLFDGTTLSAASEVDIEAGKGDFVDFIVKNKTDNQLFLETIKKPTVKQQTDADSELKKQLEALNIRPDSTSIKVAWETKANNLQFSKENIVNALDILNRFKTLDSAKAVFLTGANIAPEAKNINTLCAIMEGRFKVSNELNELLQMLSHTQETGASSDKSRGWQEGKGIVSNNSIPNSKTLLQTDSEQQLQRMHIIHDAISSIAQTAIKNEFTEKLFQLLHTDSQLLEQTEVIKGFVASQLGHLSEEQQKNVMDLIKRFVLNEKDTVLKVHASATENENMQIKNELCKDIRDIFIKLESKTLDKDMEAGKLYKELGNKLDSIREALVHSNFRGNSEILNKIDDLHESIRFLNQINNYSTYIQIPINMGSQNTTGELYILKRENRRKKIDPENTTLFISLNTQNIGRVESLISLNRKNISLNMRLDNKQIIDFIKENYRELYNSLGEKGYKLVDVKYKLIDEPVNLLNIEKIAETEISSNRVKIDFRL